MSVAVVSRARTLRRKKFDGAARRLGGGADRVSLVPVVDGQPGPRWTPGFASSWRFKRSQNGWPTVRTKAASATQIEACRPRPRCLPIAIGTSVGNATELLDLYAAVFSTDR
ncbi:MAG: hypothetical protein OXG72_15125 [Acidobacteria bacterium]|nr:hypothetical protein [Acidobacteriota bacterium]